jgi:hypothetical protein
LDGNGNGMPGSNFVRKFGSNALAGSSSLALKESLAPSAGYGPITGLQIAAIDTLAARGDLTAETVKARFHHR